MLFKITEGTRTVPTAQSWTPLFKSKVAQTTRSIEHAPTCHASLTISFTPSIAPDVTNTTWDTQCTPFAPGCNNISGTSAFPPMVGHAGNISQQPTTSQASQMSKSLSWGSAQLPKDMEHRADREAHERRWNAPTSPLA